MSLSVVKALFVLLMCAHHAIRRQAIVPRSKQLLQSIFTKEYCNMASILCLPCGAKRICFVIVICLVLVSNAGVDARKQPRQPARPSKPSRPPSAPKPSPRVKRLRGVSPSPAPFSPAPMPAPKPEPELLPEPVPEPSPEPHLEPRSESSPAADPQNTRSSPTQAEVPGVAEAIRLSMGGWGCEPNVCNEAGQCGSAVRAELRVQVPSVEGGEEGGATTWAPLCAPDALNETMQWTLASVVCNQFYNWPSTRDFRLNSNYLFSVFGWREQPLLIPIEAPAEGAIGDYGVPLFDPAKVTHWATISGWGDTAPLDVRAVQELPMEISATPCKSGRMLAVRCSLIVADPLPRAQQ